MLDFKEPGTENMLARAIRRHGFPRESLLVAGAGSASRRILRGLDPHIPLSLTLDMDQGDLITPAFLMSLDTEAITWHHRLLTPALVDILHRRDILVYAWTVDLSEDVRRMRDVCKVDGIITNSPDQAAKVSPIRAVRLLTAAPNPSIISTCMQTPCFMLTSCRHGSVVEQLFRKQQVPSSNLGVGLFTHLTSHSFVLPLMTNRY